MLSLFLSQIAPVVEGAKFVSVSPTATNPGFATPPGPPGRAETPTETSGTLTGLLPTKPISESTWAPASILYAPGYTGRPFASE